MATSLSLRRVPVPVEYRRMLVPLDDRPESLEAFELACRLAAESRATITAVFVLEIPAALPLDAHMQDEEAVAERLLERAGATGDAYGVRVTPVLVRARDRAATIVDRATRDGSELIVVGATRTQLERSRRWMQKSPLRHVLERAPCRVMLVSGPAREAA